MTSSDVIMKWRRDPVSFVREVFSVEPDEWQKNALMAFGSDDPAMKRISMQACAGPGKSTILAWCVWNFLLCYAEQDNHPKCAAVSITSDNLKDNLWSELSKWQHKSPLLMHQFEWTQTKIAHRQFPSTWFASARSFSKSANTEEIGRTLSGLHSKFILFVIDESGDIPPSIIKSAEQGLSTGPIFGKILQAGNPTSHAGMLYAAATLLRQQWYVIRITGDPDDVNRSPRIDKVWAGEQITQYGRKNPWVMAFILGEFPDSSINTLLSIEDVMQAVDRGLHEHTYNWSQKRLGIDVARFGMDSSVIFPRQGLRGFKYVQVHGLRSNEVAARVMLSKSKWGSEAEFVDGTGGYGSGVVDSLLQAGVFAHEIHYSGSPVDPAYFNKRSEMWFEMAKWIKRGGSIPNDARLIKELTAPTYTFVNGKFQLESKDQIKSRLGFSPDVADALGLTFALPDVATSVAIEMYRQTSTAKHDYDPLANDNKVD
jgi:phage terminase large subunit